MPFQIPQTTQSVTPCPRCQGTELWQNLQGSILCRVCVPIPPNGEWCVARRLAIAADGSLIDTTERDFRLRYPAETWDWFEHIHDEDRLHLATKLDQLDCAWCGRRNGQHAPACGRLHDEWLPVLTFGKHKNKKLKDVDPSYLRYLLSWSGLHQEIRREICRMFKLPYKEPVEYAS